MKRILKGLGVLLVLLVVAIAALYFVGGSKLNAAVSLPEESFAVVADSVTLARGAYLVKIHACADCHGERLEGRVMVDAPPFLAVPSNLTSGQGGIGGTYTDADWEHAIRHGVGHGGRQLVPVMPSALRFTTAGRATVRVVKDDVDGAQALPPLFSAKARK